jgi:hypothetical protein
MRFSIVTLILILVAGSILAYGKDDKKKEVPGTPGSPVEGIVYNLPQTGIRIHIKATRERYVNGPFFMYAQKMLGIDNVPTSSSERWNMDEMQIETFSEPDPDQVFKAMGAVAHLVSLTEAGILSGINSDPAPQPTVLAQTQSFLKNDLDNLVKFTDLSIWSFYSRADSTRSFKMVSKNMEQKAAEAAETIFNLRNSRFSLLTNADDEPLPDGKSFEVMTSELGKMEENYLSLFIGKSSKQTFEFSFDYIPGQKTSKGDVFFRFSEDRGVLPKSDLSGRPINIEVNKADNLASKQNSLSTSENPEAGKSGLFYRMPGMAEIRIMDGSTQLAGARAFIAQFGTIAPIPEELLDGSYSLEFYPATGAVKNITEIK